MTTARITLQQLPRVTGRSLGLAGHLLTLLDAWIERHRQRNALLELSDTMLKDIGISRADAMHEGSKPFWAP